MKALLSGPWCENQGSLSVVKTVQSASTIKALLRFIYTGEVDANAIATNPLEMLDVAAQYGRSGMVMMMMMMMMMSVSHSLAPLNYIIYTYLSIQ